MGRHVGTVGRHVVTVGRHVGTVGRLVGTVGRHVGTVGRHVGTLGRHAGTVGRHVGTVGRHVGIVGRHVGTVDRHVGTLGGHTVIDTLQTYANMKSDTTYTDIGPHTVDGTDRGGYKAYIYGAREGVRRVRVRSSTRHRLTKQPPSRQGSSVRYSVAFTELSFHSSLRI